MTEHLAYLIDQLRGVNADLDKVADGLEGLTTRTYDRDERQTTIAFLTGNADSDLVTVTAVLTQHLCTVPADQGMREQDRKTAEQHGQDVALLLTDPRLHQPASEAAALIDPSYEHADTTEGGCTAVDDELRRKNAEKNKRSEKPYPK